MAFCRYPYRIVLYVPCADFLSGGKSMADITGISCILHLQRHPQMRPPSGPGIPAPPGMPTTPGMAVYYPGGSMPPGQNAPSAVPYALYPGSIYSPSFGKYTILHDH